MPEANTGWSALTGPEAANWFCLSGAAFQAKYQRGPQAATQQQAAQTGTVAPADPEMVSSNSNNQDLMSHGHQQAGSSAKAPMDPNKLQGTRAAFQAQRSSPSRSETPARGFPAVAPQAQHKVHLDREQSLETLSSPLRDSIRANLAGEQFAGSPQAQHRSPPRL